MVISAVFPPTNRMRASGATSTCTPMRPPLTTTAGRLSTRRSKTVGCEDITTKGLEHHRRNHISLIFQSYNLIDYMTPIENVRLTAKLDAAPILERLGQIGRAHV